MHADTRRLLILTRERLLGDLLAEALTTRRYRCVVEPQAALAPDRFLAERPALAIVDLESLEYDGLDAVADIRRVDPSACVIAIIGPKAAGLESTACSLGVTDVVRRQDELERMLTLLAELGAEGSQAGVLPPAEGTHAPIVDEPATVLVVDDDPNVRRLLERILTRDGYPVLTASDGVEALERLEHDSVRVMFLDLRMPRLGGLDVLRRLKELSAPPRTVIVSGLADRELKQEAIKLGAFDYLQKPLSVDRVLVTASAAVVLDAAGRRGFWERWKRRLR